MTESDYTGPTKHCRGCDRQLPATNEHFNKLWCGQYGLQTRCRPCQRKATKAHYNTEQGKAAVKANRAARKEHLRIYIREWQQREDVKKRRAAKQLELRSDPVKGAKRRAYEAAWARAKRKADPGLTRRSRERIKQDPERYLAYLAKRKEYLQRRRQEDDVFRINLQAGADIRNALKRRPRRKGGRPLWWEKALGYSAPELKAHLERQFIDGMTWENHGILWEIDHIVPLAHFVNRADFNTAWAITNLRPLLKVLNQAKGSKLEQAVLPSL